RASGADEHNGGLRSARSFLEDGETVVAETGTETGTEGDRDRDRDGHGHGHGHGDGTGTGTISASRSIHWISSLRPVRRDRLLVSLRPLRCGGETASQSI